MDLPAATRRFVETASSRGLIVEPVVFPAGTKTAADAAAAIGCEVAAIVKSLVFVTDDEPVLVLMPGDKRVDTAKLAALTGAARTRRADLEEVREATGFAAGGTPPLGHDTPMRVYADPHLERFAEVWAAAGTPTTVFPIEPASLVRNSGATWADLAEGA